MSSDLFEAAGEVEEVCALALVRRVAAMLDLDPAAWRTGDLLPAGWHVALFTGATPQSRLRPDGVAELGVALPDLGLPRLMLGGRRVRFSGVIAIGSVLRRRSHIVSTVPKEGRSGRFVIVTVEHRIFAADAADPVLIEEQDYVMREAAAVGSPPSLPDPPGEIRSASIERELVPDETLLFRYCAITFNTHRIHYDYPYCVEVERYPGLVVNGGLPLLLLLELFRHKAGRSPTYVVSRNLGQLFCGRTIRLCAEPNEDAWRLWATDEIGRTAVEVTIQ